MTFFCEDRQILGQFQFPMRKLCVNLVQVQWLTDPGKELYDNIYYGKSKALFILYEESFKPILEMEGNSAAG